jgi:CSLREA domain-containing protein
MRKIQAGLLLIALASGMLFGFHPAFADDAATFTVTKSADTNDGQCSVSDCSLREAVIAANASPGADTITIPVGTYILTLAGQGEDAAATGDLDIAGDTTLSGAGAASTTVNGSSLDRVFHILPGVTAAMSGFAVHNGAAPGNDNLGGGGILNDEGVLTLTDLLVSNSSSQRGGGLRNSLGTVTVTGCTFQNNQAQDQGGGIYSDGVINLVNSVVSGNGALRGAGIGSSWDVTLNRVTINNNTASGDGGGVYSDYILTMYDVGISGNQANQGGGLYNFYDATLERVTFNSNHSTQNGGAIYNRDAGLTMINVTLSGNGAGPYGGGLYNAGSASASFMNSTIVNNTISPSAEEYGAGIYQDQEAFSVNLGHTIIYNNTRYGVESNCYGNTFAINSLGNNLENGQSCNLGVVTGDGDLSQVADALIGPLQNNGGAVLTHTPLTGSPAIEGGAEAGCAATDARRVLRPVDGDVDGVLRCDIGAVEVVVSGYVALAATSYVIAEDGGAATISVRRYGGSQAVQVSYVTQAGTARAGHDYVTASGVLTWNAGDTANKTFQVQVVNDIYAEDAETVIIRLFNATHGAGIVAPDDQAVLTIQASDPGGPPEPEITGPVYLPLVMYLASP